jgi:hypothetical protein
VGEEAAVVAAARSGDEVVFSAMAEKYGGSCTSIGIA